MGVLAGAEAFSSGAAAGAGTAGAPAVLLCHGFTGSPQGLRGWAQDLAAAGLSVCLPRLPGHGTSWQEMARTGWADWLGALEAELEQLRSRGHRVVVGGLSMGGGLALRLAADHPADVAGLVLVNPAVRLEDPRLAALPLLRRLGLLGRPGRERTAPAVGGDVAKPGAVELAYDRVPLRAAASMVEGLRGVARDLPLVHQPLVLLRSAADHVVPASSSALVLERVGSADVREEVLERSYHVATLDHDAARVSAATLDLVGRL
ncbi:alpha/beta hydrolase [Quadrisphaera setariae]|uniref:alpha/beta hydrolase n=1 Tax=Quadrisphaera setariae TaxID=2593304 RepID=UPI001C9D37F4|nr:alpha/beta fold hydrolase [Quadrisphaera setariae]